MGELNKEPTVDDLILELLVSADEAGKKTLEDLATKFSELKTLAGLVDKKNAELEQEIVSLKEKLSAEKQSNPLTKEGFDLDGVKYEILGNINVPGFGKLTPLELSVSVEAQRKVVAMGSGIIREIK